MIQSRLANAHYSNSHNVLFRMLSALQFSSRLQPHVCLDGEVATFLGRKSCTTEEVIYELYLSFLHSYRIKCEIINKHYVILKKLPELLAEVLLFSDVDLTTCLRFYQDVLDSASDPRVLLRLEHLISATEAALKIGFQYIDLFEVKPSLSLHCEPIDLDDCFGPHIGISFGHPSFLFESSIANWAKLQIEQDSMSSKSPVSISKSFLIYNPVVSAFPTLRFGENCLSDFISRSSEHTPVTHHWYDKLYLGDMYSRYRALLRLEECGTRTIVGTSSISTFDNLMDCANTPNDGIASLDQSFVEFITKTSSSIAYDFIHSSERLILIHTRDEKYSGPGQQYRNVSFSDYVPLIEHLIGLNFSIVRLSRTSEPCSYFHNRFLDLSRVESNLSDQLILMMNSHLIIGTASGISHWSIFFNKPVLFTNCACAAPPCSGIIERHVYSPKRIEVNQDTFPNIAKEDLIKDILSISWSSDLVQKLGCHTVPSKELIDDTMYALTLIEGKQSKLFTSHTLLSLLGIDFAGMPDFILTPHSFKNLFLNFKKILSF